VRDPFYKKIRLNVVETGRRNGKYSVSSERRAGD
jgi:hypothetical protein